METPIIDTTDGIAREVTTFTRRVPAKLPSLTDQMNALRAQLADERPLDHEHKLSKFQMHEDGTVGVTTRTPVTLNALGDLLGFIDAPRGALATISTLSPAARAVAFNDLKAQHAAKDDRLVRFRTIQKGNQRLVRAVTSDKHSGAHGDDGVVLQALAMLGNYGNPTARIVRTFERTDIEVFFPGLKTEVKVNDVSYAKLHIVNSEVRKASFDAGFGLFRLVCTNGMTRSAEGVTTTVRHMGDISFKVRAAIEGAFAGAEEFFLQWQEAQDVALSGTRSDVLERLEKRLKALPSGLWKEAAILWDADGELGAGDTVAGLVNAMTRASQAYDYATAAAIEREAGRIVEGQVL